MSYKCAGSSGSVIDVEKDQSSSRVPYKNDDRQFNSCALPKQIRVEIEGHKSDINSDYKTVPEESVAYFSIPQSRSEECDG